MKNTIGNFRQFVVSALVVGSLLISVQAQANRNVEYYSDRPNILNLRPEADNHKGWEKLRWAQTEFLAQLFGLYPTETFYFLARDGEYPYDLALLLTRKFPKMQARVKLINISRGNQDNPRLQEYLQQEGLTNEAIAKNGIVFVDTGYKGSIGRLVRDYYPEKIQRKIKIHLMASDVDNIPESMIFSSRQSMGVEDFEGMPRFSYRSDNFTHRDGVLVPTNRPRQDGFKDDEGEVSKPKALKYMKGTAAFVENPEVLKLFELRIRQFQFAREVVEDPNKSLKELREFVSTILTKWEDKAKTAFAKDIVEHFVLNSKKRLVPDDEFFFMTKRWFPDWSEILHEWSRDYPSFLKGATQTDIQDLANLTIRHHDYQDKGGKGRDLVRIIKSRPIDYDYDPDEDEREIIKRGSIEPVAKIVDAMHLAQALVFFSEIETTRGVEARNQIFELLKKQISSPEKIWVQVAQRFELKASKKAEKNDIAFLESLQDKRMKVLKCKHLFF